MLEDFLPPASAEVLMALTEGGMQYLVAGARASVGMKAQDAARQVSHNQNPGSSLHWFWVDDFNAGF